MGISEYGERRRNRHSVNIEARQITKINDNLGKLCSSLDLGSSDDDDDDYDAKCDVDHQNINVTV